MFFRYVAFFLIFSLSATAAPLFNPKIIGKFNYLGGSKIQKYAGALALENEFFSFLSAGFQAGLGKGGFRDENISGDVSGGTSTVFVDLGFYIKPQLALDFDMVIFTPYISFYLGVPSFTNKDSDKFVFTQNYSTMVGLELTLFKHLILVAEGGISAVSRMVKSSTWHFPGVVNAGIGYRF